MSLESIHQACQHCQVTKTPQFQKPTEDLKILKIYFGLKLQKMFWKIR